MAVVGHWDSLAEAQKLVQSVLLKGVVQTVIEGGHILPMMPVKQITGKDLLYNREDSWTAEDGAAFFDIREQIDWSSDVTYSQVTVPLKRIIRQDPIDNFVKNTYSDPNDYKALMITQLAKRMTRFLEFKAIYGDVSFGGSKEFDGLHALAEENTGDLDIDEGEGPLSLANLRLLLDACKVDTEAESGASGRENTIILMPRPLARRIDASLQEAQFVRTNVTHGMGQITFGRNEFGARTTFFDGIPIVRSDFLQAENANTGVGSDARAVYTSGTKMYSIFVVRFGQTEDGGLALLFGNPEGNAQGEVFSRTSFDKLENFDSGGERLVTYMALTLGAGVSCGRIYDITDAEVTP
jgi:hypothetical protein|tara:strand:- start:312 stop:1370 length:1059 start_codon:yes stop_codon:yes gene_type:complete